MGVSIQPVLETEVEEAPHVEGKALMMAEMSMGLNDLATELEIIPLIAFGDADQIVGQGETTWHPAAEGLETVRALLDRLRADPGALRDDDGILGMIYPGEEVSELQQWLVGDLEDLERVLVLAEAKDIRFYLHWSV